jgi:GNAT superfamily N-acetyltransferase
MTNIRIEEVKTGKHLKKFIRFPWSVYGNDPHWVPPLILDVKEKLDRMKNPFFEHAEMDVFLAYKGTEIRGRIAAIIDHSHNQMHGEKTAFFGMFECRDDLQTAQALIGRAASWAKEHGMTNLRGPMNLSMNDECALLLEGFDSPPMIMMPYNPPYYLELMSKCGLVKAKDLFAYKLSQDSQTKKDIRAVVDQISGSTTVTLRTLDFSRMESEINKVKSVYNQAWEKNWGFVPWTDKEMDHMARKLKQLADPRLIILAEDEGRPVGFAFGLPNWNEVMIQINGRLFPFGIFKILLNKRKMKGVRALVFGILKEYRLTGLSYLLYQKFIDSALEAGYQWGETSWQLEDNEAVNRFAESLGAELYKKYRIYEKSID